MIQAWIGPRLPSTNETAGGDWWIRAARPPLSSVLGRDNMQHPWIITDCRSRRRSPSRFGARSHVRIPLIRSAGVCPLRGGRRQKGSSLDATTGAAMNSPFDTARPPLALSVVIKTYKLRRLDQRGVEQPFR